MSLSAEQRQRYARQLLLPEVGEAGQEKLARHSVLIIGMGGLGSPAAYYLTAAGIGRLGLVDNDRVEFSNLHRQIIHFTPDLQKQKVISAAEKLHLLNPEVHVEPYLQHLDSENLTSLGKKYDFIIDATDNFSSKFMISDTCVQERMPFSHAGISGFSGQIFTYIPGKQCGCYRCLFPSPPEPVKIPDKAQGGILGTVPGTLGTWQATEAIKYLLGTGNLLTNRLLIYDAKSMQIRTVAFKPSAKCIFHALHT